MRGISNMKRQTCLKNKISFATSDIATYSACVVDSVCSDVGCCEGDFVFAKHPISNSNSKHIDVGHDFLRELVERKEIEIIHVASQYQHANFLTKALPETEFHRGIVMNLK